jgi:hypothetical protein
MSDSLTLDFFSCHSIPRTYNTASDIEHRLPRRGIVAEGNKEVSIDSHTRHTVLEHASEYSAKCHSGVSIDAARAHAPSSTAARCRPNASHRPMSQVTRMSREDSHVEGIQGRPEHRALICVVFLARKAGGVAITSMGRSGHNLLEQWRFLNCTTTVFPFAFQPDPTDQRHNNSTARIIVGQC